MKKWFFIVILMSGIQLMAQSPDSLFRKANNDYQNSDFEDAINLYLEIDSLGYHSAELYYNTGNAYFRSNKLGKARLYYEKAMLLKPNDDDIRNNLTYTESLLTDRFDEVPVLFFVGGTEKWLPLFIREPGQSYRSSCLDLIRRFYGVHLYQENTVAAVRVLCRAFLFLFSMICLLFRFPA